jgi:hypothetical protein
MITSSRPAWATHINNKKKEGRNGREEGKKGRGG